MVYIFPSFYFQPNHDLVLKVSFFVDSTLLGHFYTLIQSSHWYSYPVHMEGVTDALWYQPAILLFVYYWLLLYLFLSSFLFTGYLSILWKPILIYTVSMFISLDSF